VARGLHAGKSALRESVEEVVRLLPVRDAREAAVLAFEQDARVRHHRPQEPTLTLGEPERLKARTAGDVSR
jgi:hypothetical protein